jgi:hypothetical protein
VARHRECWPTQVGQQIGVSIRLGQDGLEQLYIIGVIGMRPATATKATA